MGKFTVETGNIFSYAKKVDYITNANNSVGTMGGGLAYQFIRNLNYASYCIEYNAISASLQKNDKEFDKFNGLSAGVTDTMGLKLIRPLVMGTPKEDGVLFFATKIHYSKPSEMEYLEVGFKLLNEDESLAGLTFAMPLLGGGLGGLDPAAVEAKMKELTEGSIFDVILVKPS